MIPSAPPYPQPSYTDIVQSPIIIPVYPQGYAYPIPVPQNNIVALNTPQYPVFNPYSVSVSQYVSSPDPSIQRALDSIPGYSSVNTLDTVTTSFQRLPTVRQRLRIIFFTFICLIVIAVFLSMVIMYYNH